MVKHERACRYSGREMGSEVLNDDCCCTVDPIFRAKQEVVEATWKVKRAQYDLDAARARLEILQNRRDRW